MYEKGVCVCVHLEKERERERNNFDPIFYSLITNLVDMIQTSKEHDNVGGRHCR